MAHACPPDQPAGSPLARIARVRLPNKPPSARWDISIHEGRIASIDAHDSSGPAASASPSTLQGHGRLIAPSLCHAHIHLDKCFLLQDPKYSDLQLENGDFKEALALTDQAKSRFDEDDLLRRGRQLITESMHHGVTAMRAFVEVDALVQLKCLKAGLELKAEFSDTCHVQICAFAQLPLYSGHDHGAKVRQLMTTAASYSDVEVLGSTPYVEDDETKSRQNVRWITQMALKHNKHLDLHLDYFLQDKQPLIWAALDIIKEEKWVGHAGRQIALGHCTRLTRFHVEEWTRLKRNIQDLPITFIGLPSSDLFIMNSPDDARGTLPVIRLINEYQFNAAIAVNNVGNAFTPQGNCDPLALAQLGVGLYHAGTEQHTELLFVSRPSSLCTLPLTLDPALQEAVSSRAKDAIGLESTSLDFQVGQPADFVLFDGDDRGWRCRKSISEVVYDAGHARQTVYRGRVTAVTM